jgi:hypothetical protein
MDMLVNSVSMRKFYSVEVYPLCDSVLRVMLEERGGKYGGEC